MNLGRHNHRGNTLILVLAMLSLLGLAVIAFSYGARLEAIASSNFSRRIQARMTANIGLAAALPLAAEATSVTTTLQPWNFALAATSAPLRRPDGTPSVSIVPSALARRTGTTAPPPAGFARANDPGQAVIAIGDLSGRVNMNTVRSPKALERFLEAVFREAGATSPDEHVGLRARATMVRRDGRVADKATTSTMQPDLRKAPASGGRRIESLSDLAQKGTPSSMGLFTGAELQVLAPHVTVFSQSPEVFNFRGGALPKLPIDSEPGVREIHALLKRVFPGHENRLLLQFAANIVDFIDGDNVPTVVTDQANPQPWNAILGLEKTPLITEVYPDSATSVGDFGQFVELFNPWDEPIVLANWRLAIGGGMGFGEPSRSVTLNTTIQPGGYVIITDNYDAPELDSEPGTGSFLSVFGARADGALRRIVVDPNFALPDENSFVVLADGANHPVDVFSYTAAAGRNTLRSYQRDDPRVRAFAVADATPFDRPPPSIYKGGPQRELALRNAWRGAGNAPLASPTDLLRVSTAYAGLRGSGQQSILQPHGWQAPALRPPDGEEDPGTNLDVRVIDLFVVPQQWAEPARDRRTGESPADRNATPSGDVDADDVIYSYGKLNVNTCHRLALLSLDLEVDGRDHMTPALLAAFDRHRGERLAQRRVPFLNTSDLLVALFPNPSEADLAVFAKLADQVTVGSSAFEITTSNRAVEAGSDTGSGNRAPAVSRAYWAVSLDSAPCSILALRSLP